MLFKKFEHDAGFFVIYCADFADQAHGAVNKFFVGHIHITHPYAT